MDLNKVYDITTKIYKLNSGYSIPAIGLGTYHIKTQQTVEEAIFSAYQAGYRHIDSAVVYRNENLIGQALKKFNIPREEMFITTKIMPKDMNYENATLSINQSLINFETSYIDMYLIHWPEAKSIEDRLGVWKALEEGVESGKIRSIGLSNFLPRHLKSILEFCKIKPAVNQFELHPLFVDYETIDLCNKEGIQIQAYSTFARMDQKLIENPVLIGISEKYKKSATQVLVRWAVQHGWVVLPKSSNRKRIFENFDVNDFNLSEDELKSLDTLNCNYKVAWDPSRVEL
jgi:diketogulonate reductase-like aldo/keto reductase